MNTGAYNCDDNGICYSCDDNGFCSQVTGGGTSPVNTKFQLKDGHIVMIGVAVFALFVLLGGRR